MSPRTTFFLALAAVLAAGIPLLRLTAPPTFAATAPAASAATGCERVYATVRFTGSPVQGILRWEGKDIATLPSGCPSPWETELLLPTPLSLLELEAEFHWPEGSPQQAVTISLEPPNQPARQDTQWAEDDSLNLHTIFTFNW